jgi:hypothetical protein
MFQVPSDTRSLVMNQNATIDGEITISLWVKAPQGDPPGANNATIRIDLYNNNNRQSFYTNNQEFGKTPVLFTATGMYHQEFRSGDTFKVQLIWIGHARNGIGPTPRGELLFGNERYDSNIQVPISPNPLTITRLTVGGINKKNLTVQADFTDSFKADPSGMVCDLSLSNYTRSFRASHIEGPFISKGPEGSSSVAWTWDHKKDKALAGVYNITVAISYDGNNTTSMNEELQIDIPKQKEEGSNIRISKEQGYLILTTIVCVVSDVSILSFFYFWKKRKENSMRLR